VDACHWQKGMAEGIVVFCTHANFHMTMPATPQKWVVCSVLILHSMTIVQQAVYPEVEDLSWYLSIDSSTTMSNSDLYSSTTGQVILVLNLQLTVLRLNLYLLLKFIIILTWKSGYDEIQNSASYFFIC
jgi:hypothetical protein